MNAPTSFGNHVEVSHPVAGLGGNEETKKSGGMKSSLWVFVCALAISFAGSLVSVSDEEPRHFVDAQPQTRRELDTRPQPFDFDAAFGDNMVLQHGEATQAAVYGFLGPDCVGVQFDLYTANPTTAFEKPAFSTMSTSVGINVTHQPFNTDNNDHTWGVKPCAQNDDTCKPFNPWNQPLPKWKVLLPPQAAGGNFTISATCILRENDESTNTDETLYGEEIQLNNVTFGDVYYCSGQSNMWLPLKYTFHRIETRDAIQQENKYHNIRIMAGSSESRPYGMHKNVRYNYAKYGSADGTNPWMTSLQALDNDNFFESSFGQFGAACWHFGQHLTDLGINHPIGLVNTAVGGQRIQEFMDNRTIAQCHNRTRAAQGNEEKYLGWQSMMYATQVLPFVDMTLKGFLWYQGENNMWEVKGNSHFNVGYGCELREMIKSWRKIWSEAPGTTSPTAPFGIVTLQPGTDEGGPDMGSMRHAQTLNYGVLPPPHHPIIGDESIEMLEEADLGLANTFLAQAYDLNDEWLANAGPCFEQKCCALKNPLAEYDPKVCRNQTLHDICNSGGACAVGRSDRMFMGNIHPRTKREVGQRLAKAAFNLFLGGKEAYTGPTLQGCSVKDKENLSVLEIRFNTTLLRGDSLAEPKFAPRKVLPKYNRVWGGSQLYVKTEASTFCMEEAVVFTGQLRSTTTTFVCPRWAGGTEQQSITPVHAIQKGIYIPHAPFEDGWIEVPFTLKNGNTIEADLSRLPSGATPIAVKYAWGFANCCDRTDPEMFITKSCTADCPIKLLNGGLPANPFKARIVDGKCECLAPQKCTDQGDDTAGVHE